MSEHLPTPPPEHEPAKPERDLVMEANRADAQIELIEHLLDHSDQLVWLQRTSDDGSMDIQGGITVETLRRLREELIAKGEYDQ